MESTPGERRTLPGPAQNNPNRHQHRPTRRPALTFLRARSLRESAAEWKVDCIACPWGGRTFRRTPSDDLQVEFYVNGQTQFTGLVLGSGLASDLAIMGTTNCTHIHYSGQSDYVGTVYAPQANFHVSGQGGMVGAAVADTVQMTGQGDFHYDESLADLILGSAGDYELTSWIEL